MAGTMASYGAYYYSTSKPEPRADAPSRREEVRSPPPPSRFGDRPGTAARHYQRRRSITPPDGERARSVPYYQQEMERPGNPGSTQERGGAGGVYYDQRPVTAYQPVPQNTPYTPPATRPQGRKRPDSPDPSVFSEISEPEIKPNYSPVDYYTYSKCLERVISDPNLAMPVRLGVVGKWGAGKSKIMKGILWCLKQACDTTCSHLSEPMDAPTNIRWKYRTCYCCDMSFFTYLFLLFVLLLASVACVLLAFLLGVAPYVIEDYGAAQTSVNLSGLVGSGGAYPATTTTTQSNSVVTTLSQESIALIVTVTLVAILLLLICSAGMFKCLKDRYMRGTGEMLAHFRALVVMALCDVPPPPQSTTDKVEIIPICFNASEFSGTKDSWSALTIHILTQCESMFGFWKSRFYRVCARDLEHEHDFLIADEDKWRRHGQEKTSHRTNRSLASAMPINTKLPPNLKSDLNANRSPKTIPHRAQNGTAGSSAPGAASSKHHRPTFKAKKHNKVVATEDDFGKKLDIPVHTAKWKSIGYPMLITIGLVSVISATVILIVIGLALDLTMTDQIIHYIILSLSILVILIPTIVMIKNLIVLLMSACSSPRQRIEKLRKESLNSSSYKRMVEGDTQGFMHHVKNEVNQLIGFVRYMEHIYQRRFRILITIEDIEKCPEQTMVDLLDAIQVLFGDPSFPIIVMISVDSEQIVRALNRAGKESAQKYLYQLLNMRFCVPDSSHDDIVKLLENQAEHLLCSTSVRVNRLRELSEKKYNSDEYRLSRREAIRQLDLQHDYEDRSRLGGHDNQPYYSNPVSARHVTTARSRRTKSSRSKKRVVFTPLKASSEDGLDGPTPQPPQSATEKAVPPAADKIVTPAVTKTDTPGAPATVNNAASPQENRKQSTPAVTVAPAARPTTADRPDTQLSRPDSQLSRVKSPGGLSKSDMRRENSILAEESSEEEDDDEPEYLLALSAGEARKENLKGAISTRRPQLADSEKTEEQLNEQNIHSVAEMKVLLGVSHKLYTALITNPSYELSVSYDSALGSIKNIPSHVNLQDITKEQLKRHILAYGLRRRMVYLALDEVSHSIKLLDSTFTRMTQLFNTVVLSISIWTQKLKQLGIVDAILDDKESDKVMVKLIKSCQELTHWVMLCELWPYRSSWLIYKVERVNRKMGDFPSSNFYLEASIRDIYRDIRPDIKAASEEFEVWRGEDFTGTGFNKCLERFKDISGVSVLRYLPFTINIDRIYKNRICQYMSAGGGNINSVNKDEDKESAIKSITFADQPETQQEEE